MVFCDLPGQFFFPNKGNFYAPFKKRSQDKNFKSDKQIIKYMLFEIFLIFCFLSFINIKKQKYDNKNLNHKFI